MEQSFWDTAITGYDSEHEPDPRQILDSSTVCIDDTIGPHFPTTYFQFRLLLPYASMDSLRPMPNPGVAEDVAFKVLKGEDANLIGFDVVGSLDQMFRVRTVKAIDSRYVRRFCLRRNFVWRPSRLRTMLIYTDGAMTARREESSPRAGCAFQFGDSVGDIVAFSLAAKERDGTDTRSCPQRTPMRAVLEALRFKDWYREGWTCVVIQTTLNRLLQYARFTENLGDLLEELAEIVKQYAECGCEVSFVPMRRTPEQKTLLSRKIAEHSSRCDMAEEYRLHKGIRYLPKMIDVPPYRLPL